MTLVDSSVWISLLRGRSGHKVNRLRQLLEDGEAALAAIVIQELLQGARSEEALATLRQRFLALPLLAIGIGTHVAAGTLYARCRWQGITPRSPQDCLVAAVAMEHDVALLAEDRDFKMIRSVQPSLKLMQ